MLHKLKSKLLAEAPAAATIEEEKTGADPENPAEYRDISFDLEKLNFAAIRKKRAFVCSSANKIHPVMPADPSVAKNLEDFRLLGDVLPIEPVAAPSSAADF